MDNTFEFAGNTIEIIEPHVELLTPISWLAEYPRMIEQAGRTCYMSEDKITSSSSGRFIKQLLKSGHLSVLEHCSVTVKFVGDRSMSHQLVRHRIAAYSQRSQRYCNFGNKGFQMVLPPSIVKANRVHDWKHSIGGACATYMRLLEDHVPPEDARSVLPNATLTEVVTTFNLRQWRHVFDLRALDNYAQWQIRGLMQRALVAISNLVWYVFDDQRYRLHVLLGDDPDGILANSPKFKTVADEIEADRCSVKDVSSDNWGRGDE